MTSTTNITSNLFVYTENSPKPLDSFTKSSIIVNAITDLINRTSSKICKSNAEHQLKLLARKQYERAYDGSTEAVLFAVELFKCTTSLLREREITEKQISAGYDLVLSEARHFLTSHSAEISAGLELADIYKAIASSFVESKLKSEDAKIFTQIVMDMWTRCTTQSNESSTHTAIVSIQNVFSEPTNKSKLINGNCSSMIFVNKCISFLTKYFWNVKYVFVIQI